MVNRGLGDVDHWESMHGYSLDASGKNKGVVRLLLVRTRVWSGRFWQKRSGQAASGENEGVVRLLLVRTRVWSDCFW